MMPEARLPAMKAAKISTAAPKMLPAAVRIMLKKSATEFDSVSIRSAVSDEMSTGRATST